jgi:hypothetical protein
MSEIAVRGLGHAALKVDALGFRMCCADPLDEGLGFGFLHVKVLEGGKRGSC